MSPKPAAIYILCAFLCGIAACTPKSGPATDVVNRSDEVFDQATDWSYATSSNPMNGAVELIGYRNSDNTIDLTSPNDGPQHVMLILRSNKDGHNEPGVLLILQRGAFDCNPSQGCEIEIRFDKKKSMKYRAFEPENGDKASLVLDDDSSRFLEGELDRKNKIMLVAADISGNGQKIFSYDVSGFSFDKVFKDSTNSATSTDR